MFDMGKDDKNKTLLFLLEYRHIANCIRNNEPIFQECVQYVDSNLKVYHP